MGTGNAALYRFSTEQFLIVWEGKVLGELCRVELLDGQLIDLGEITGQHLWTVSRTGRALHLAGDDIGMVSIQSPLIFDEHTTFLTDVALLRRDTASNMVPTTAEALLVVEVAEAQARYERANKLPRYASAGIPEAWIFDLVGDSIERHTDPRNGAYQRIAKAERGERVASTTLPNLFFDVAILLGPRENESDEELTDSQNG